MPKLSFQGPLIAVILISLVGCVGNAPPNIPVNWIENTTPIATDDLADGSTPKLHIFIMYGSLFPLHTALRVYHPEIGAAFWDPEGGYGTEGKKGPRAKRVKDLVVDPVPTVRDYLYFREVNFTKKTEVFEFELRPEVAAELLHLLTPPKKGEKANYDTDIDGPFCSSAISKFLQKHSDQTVATPQVCLPQTFSKYLYEQNPDRVIIADNDQFWEYHY